MEFVRRTFAPTSLGRLNKSGQIIATENTTDFPQTVVFRKGNPRKFQGNLKVGEILFHLASNIWIPMNQFI